MRKYRAWHKKRKELLNVDIIDFKNETIEIDCETIPFDDVDLEQETGVTDKNEKEIYQGDICWYIDTAGNEGRVIVGFEDGSFIIFKGGAWLPFPQVDFTKVSVVGNIHENGGLINE